jgi:hypothetical protein
MPLPAYTLIRLEMQLETLPTILNGTDVRLAEVRPKDGGWSLKENLAHLARYSHVFLQRMDRILLEEKPDLGTYRADQDSEWASWLCLSLEDVIRRLQSTRARLSLGPKLSRTNRLAELASILCWARWR